MRRIELLKTSSFRLILGYAAFFSISVLAMLATIYVYATNAMLAELDSQVAGEIEEITSAASGRDISTLLTEVRELTQHPEAGMFYLLQGADGNVIAGSLGAMTPVDGLRYWDEDDAGRPYGAPANLRGKGQHVTENAYLFVGIDAAAVGTLRAVALRTSIWGLAVILAMGIAGGVLTSLRVVRRVETLIAASHDIVDHDWSRRVPLRGSNDEFDQLAASLNGLFDRIETLMSGLQQVSTDIAHDLRTPMSRLRQGLDRAFKRGADVDTLREAIAQAMREVDIILDTFNALLRVAEIEAHTRRAGFTVFDFSAFLRTIVDDYRPVAEEQGRELAGKIEDGLSVRGDSRMLTQMFANIIENAIGHTPPLAPITVIAHRDAGAVIAEVVDLGPGIPSSAREKVFQRLYRLEASRTTPGTGMGLSIVAAIAAQHDVKITLEDNHPGLRVVMRFPALDTAHVEPSTT